MFSIGEFARLGTVTVRALRHYEDVGLVAPMSVDPDTGYRRYSAHQLPRLHRIVALKELGLSLAQIRPLLDEIQAGELRGMLQLKRAELVERMAEDTERLARVERHLRYIEGEAKVLTDVIVKNLPALRVAAVRGSRSTPEWDGTEQVVADGYVALAQELKAAGVRREGPLFSFHELGPDGSIVHYAAVAVGDQTLPPDGAILDVTLPAVEVACAVHRGRPSHDEIGPVYEQLWRWAEDNGFEGTGPGRDLLIEMDSTFENFVMELQLPIKSHSA